MKILYGILIGLGSGFLVGLVMMAADALFYGKFVQETRMARKYQSMFTQLIVFMFISVVYGGIQAAIFLWLMPLLPVNVMWRGIVFGLISYLILSRHFAEGFAFMNPELFPTRVSLYLAIEFLVAYELQGVIISRGLAMLL
ncbi:MAG TPA: hypothetical protein VHQ46_05975 [Desulfobacteria bacterium]|nr:hypothetical protein [Desulfobacteria bacterium]